MGTPKSQLKTDAGSMPVPFIVGCGRSGTTLLRAMFDSHPGMAVPPESYFVASMGRHRRRYERAGVFVTERFIEDLLAHQRFDLWALPEREVREVLRDEEPADLPDAIRLTYRTYAASRGKPRYGDKTPSYVLHLPLLADMFPEARFIHIIRDGHDVALSMLNIAWGPNSVEDAALHWRRHVSRGRKEGERLGPERYREVRYEDLVAEPETVIRSLCPFLDLPFEESMLRYFERAEEVMAGSRDRDKHKRLALPPTHGLRDWRTQMDARDLATFDALAGNLLHELGYQRGAAPPMQRRLMARYQSVRRQTTVFVARSIRSLRRRLRRRSRGRD